MDTRFLSIFLLCSGLLLSCSKHHADAKQATAADERVWNSNISLNDAVSDAGCLSVEKFYTGLQYIRPGQNVLVVPNSIAFDSERNIRENFRRLISYGQLVIEQRTISQLQSQSLVAQENCEKFTVTDKDGYKKEFTVKESTRESITGETEEGERLQYTWLSPQSFRISRRYLAYDVPCSSDMKPIFVTVEKTMDWSDASVPAGIPEKDSPLSVDPQFLKWAAETVGDDPSSLYTTDAEGNRLLDVAKVAEMIKKTPRAEVVSCTGLANPSPVPEPSPEDPADPDRPPRDGGDDGGSHP